MSASRRRRVSKWDVVENILPENDSDNAHPNSDKDSFHECEFKDHMSGKRGDQKADRLIDESIPGYDGDEYYPNDHDGRRQQKHSRSPSRSRSRSYRSRSRSKSRSRSPAHNPLPKPLCRDFAAGRCRKGHLCHFAHHGRSDHESKRRLETRVGSAQKSMHRDDDEAVRSHSNTYSTGGRSKDVCNDFLKGRCKRGALCKYPHHDSGNDAISKDDRRPKHNLDGIQAKDEGQTQTRPDQNNVISDFSKVGSSGDNIGHHSASLNLQGPASKEENNGGANEVDGVGPKEDVDVKDGVNDAKKAKDAKEMRPFKFELAEFVKELLRPTWKEGQMSKEVYKTIVKKVVDKVSESIQADHVPRTKEKIDQYLSFSKPKLSKLVQAYLERYQKPISGQKMS